MDKQYIIDEIRRTAAANGGHAPSAVADSGASHSEKPKDKGDEVFGFVYLIRSGRHYKIGRSNSTGRRQYELAIQLPGKMQKVHEIRTDDPTGIEAYWHNRFSDKRKNREWFELAPADIAAFGCRKFMLRNLGCLKP